MQFHIKDNNIYRYSDEKVAERMTKFWEEHRNKYDFIMASLLDDEILKRFGDYKETPSEILQMYDYTKVVKDEHNIYQKFADFYIQKFPESYDYNILEVACGCMPVMANKIQLWIESNKGKGQVTVCEPNMADIKFPKLVIKKERLELYTDISQYNLLMGMFTCEATELIIDKALLEKKELCLQLCGCVPDYYYGEVSYEEWVNAIYHHVKEHKSNEFEFDINKLDPDLYPLLTLQRK